MAWFTRKSSYYGIDINEQKIVMANVSKSGSKYEVNNFGEIATPQGVIEGNVIVNEEAVSNAIRQLAEQMGAASAKIALAVSGDNIITRNLVMPVMPENELAEAVRIETEALIPIPGKEVTIDFIKYNTTNDTKSKKQDILAVAAKNEVINRLARIISSAGLQPTVMDIEPLALLRAIRLLDSAAIPQENSYAIVNIGSSSTNISVFEAEQMFFTRTLGFGVFKLSLGLANHYNWSFEEAELAVKQAAIAIEGETDNVSLNQTNEILIPKINGLITEVRRSMEYYMTQRSGHRIETVFVTGVGAGINGLTEYMNSVQEFPVKAFNPLDHLQLTPKLKQFEELIKGNGPALTKVVGLALSEAV